MDWDADGYARLSTPQQSWGDEVLGRLRLRGDELVFDLGCGAGLVTERLLALVPRGRVIAVDASAAMARATEVRLGNRLDVVVADIRDFSWSVPADAVVSTAVLHWIPDHASLWRHVHGLLRPGGMLSVQYGGAGNIPGVEQAMGELARREPFAPHLAPFRSPWTFDTEETAHRELADAGFTDLRVWTERRRARPPDMRAFLANAIAPSELERLPGALREHYAAALFDALGAPEELAYVRLNADARAA